jgi:myosin heavy subunit
VCGAAIEHYAGLVTYDAHTFVDKNKDVLLLNLMELWEGSTNPLMRVIYNEDAQVTSPAASKASAQSQASQFKSQVSWRVSCTAVRRAHAPCPAGVTACWVVCSFVRSLCWQLETLMETLKQTTPHFVRCVKPNDMKRPDCFDANSCLQQLRYAGVFDAVKIRQRGYPFRWTHEVFFKRYRACGEAAKMFGRHLGPGVSYLAQCKQV